MLYIVIYSGHLRQRSTTSGRITPDNCKRFSNKISNIPKPPFKTVMLSEEQEQALVSLCNRFITSGEDVGLVHLIDLVNSTIPNQDSQEWKAWTKHMDQLNKTWLLINREGENIPWPTVHTLLPVKCHELTHLHLSHH